MADLYVTRAVPNPVGKDRSSRGATNDQLNGEWVEFLNTTQGTLSLEGVSLVHQTFNQYCQRSGSDVVTTFSNSLGSGKSVRVHTGSGTGVWEGNVFHLFLGRGNYIWNNACGDSVILQNQNGLIDWAAYDRNPTEGRVLARIAGTNKLA